MEPESSILVDADLRISANGHPFAVHGSDGNLTLDVSPVRAWKLRRHAFAGDTLANHIGRLLPAGTKIDARVRILKFPVKRWSVCGNLSRPASD